MTRLDERIARSPVGQGWIERSHFTDASASLWIHGELVHLEDLVLHDATKHVRTPTDEETVARDVLRTRRRIAAQTPGWALSPDGLRSLRGQAATEAPDRIAGRSETALAADAVVSRQGEEVEDGVSPLDAAYAAIDAVLARSNAAIEQAKQPPWSSFGAEKGQLPCLNTVKKRTEYFRPRTGDAFTE